MKKEYFVMMAISIVAILAIVFMVYSFKSGGEYAGQAIKPTFKPVESGKVLVGGESNPSYETIARY